tara:strand:+ start:182 stop:301 length:120 start_codon:yes stop_codon:yes gene_type:complete
MNKPTFEQMKKSYLTYMSGETNGGEWFDMLAEYFGEESK